MVLLIDSNQLCYRSLYSTGNLSFEGSSTGVLYGFLNSILKLSEFFVTRKLVFLWDSKYSKRKEIYPDYKGNRKKNLSSQQIKTLNDAYEQVEMLKKDILPGLGFTAIYEQRGYEADDLIASIAMSLNNESKGEGETAIISSDNDLWQLLSLVTTQYNFSRDEVMTSRSFQDQWGISCAEWSRIKAFAGCPTDNVKGLQGYGYKKTTKLLRENTKKFYDLWDNNKKMMELNMKLVHLPFEGTPTPDVIGDLNQCIDGGSYFDYFLELCSRYDFGSFNKKENVHRWKYLLKESI